MKGYSRKNFTLNTVIEVQIKTPCEPFVSVLWQMLRSVNRTVFKAVYSLFARSNYKQDKEQAQLRLILIHISRQQPTVCKVFEDCIPNLHRWSSFKCLLNSYAV